MSAQLALPVPTLLMRFTVWGSPVPLARARRGANGHWYTPTASREYAELVVQCARFQTDAFEHEPMALWRTPNLRPELAAVLAEPAIEIRADFFFFSRRRMDVDNVQKAIGDALVKGGIIRDDSYTTLRRWSVAGHHDRFNPRAEIEIHRAEPVRRGRR